MTVKQPHENQIQEIVQMQMEKQINSQSEISEPPSKKIIIQKSSLVLSEIQYSMLYKAKEMV